VCDCVKNNLENNVSYLQLTADLQVFVEVVGHEAGVRAALLLLDGDPEEVLAGLAGQAVVADHVKVLLQLSLGNLDGDELAWAEVVHGLRLWIRRLQVE
jgi:hypothetical protein